MFQGTPLVIHEFYSLIYLFVQTIILVLECNWCSLCSSYNNAIKVFFSQRSAVSFTAILIACVYHKTYCHCMKLQYTCYKKNLWCVSHKVVYKKKSKWIWQVLPELFKSCTCDSLITSRILGPNTFTDVEIACLEFMKFIITVFIALLKVSTYSKICFYTVLKYYRNNKFNRTETTSSHILFSLCLFSSVSCSCYFHTINKTAS